jgi:3-carboxy-cis,cis-muconate cycloisomerase
MTNPPASSLLLMPLASSSAMRAMLSDRARLQRMLDFESALTRAEAALGVVPASVVDPIAAACRAELYDIAALGEAAAAMGEVAQPLVSALTAEVAKTDAQAAGCVHWGAAGQDLVDTALVIELRAAIDALAVDLNRAIEAFIALAGRQRRTASVARVWLRHALPMPFGLKAAGYAGALGRARERLRRVRRESLVLQFGGSAGTLAALGEQALNVSERLAALLDLPAAEAPWHNYRDRLGDVAAALAILCGTCGKIARDISLLMQTEVGEAFEAGSRNEASILPPDRHPAAMALTAAVQAPQLLATILAAGMQEHERSGLQAEWSSFPALVLVASGAIGSVADMAQGVEVDPDRMRANADVTQGRIMAEAIVSALAAKVGFGEARKLVEEASQRAVAEKRSLQNVLADDARVGMHLAGPALARLFEPMSYQGAAQTFVDRLVGTLKSSAGKRT